MREGAGLISRGELGLMVAGKGVSSRAPTNDIYTTIITIVTATTIITPIWLKFAYKHLPSESESLPKVDNQ